MMRFLLLIAIVCVNGRATFAQMEKPTLYVIHSDTCPPCLNFDRVFTNRPEFRRALEDACTLRQLDFNDPEDRAFCRKLGITQVPAYVLFRGNRRVATHIGWTMSTNDRDVDDAIQRLCDSLNVQWPPAPPRVPKPVVAPVPPKEQPITPASAVDVEARREITKLAIQSKQLQAAQETTRQAVESLRTDVQDIKSQVANGHLSLQEKLNSSSAEQRSKTDAFQQAIEQLQKSHEKTQADLGSMSTDLKKSIEHTLASAAAKLLPVPEKPFPDLPQVAIDSASRVATSRSGQPETAAKWLSVLAFVGKTAVTIAAPEIAIPGSAALTAAGLALTWFRRRKATKSVLPPLGSETNPITISDPSGVRTETKFVVAERDVLGEGYAEAIRRIGNLHRETNPGIVDVLAQIDGCARQLAHGRRVVRRPQTEPASETRP